VTLLLPIKAIKLGVKNLVMGHALTRNVLIMPMENVQGVAIGKERLPNVFQIRLIALDMFGTLPLTKKCALMLIVYSMLLTKNA